MSRFQRDNFGSENVAILHHAGGFWRVIAGRTGLQPAIKAFEMFPDSSSGQIDAWLDDQGVDHVICVLPAATTICWMANLPNGTDDQLAAALALQAEAHAGDALPPHRIGSAVLPKGAGESTRSGLVVSWPEVAGFSIPTRREVTFAPETVAMAALVGTDRPGEPMVWVDRDRGSIAMGVSHTNGMTYRGTKEQLSTADWSTQIRRTVAETALSVGHGGSFVEAIASGAEMRVADLGANDARLVIPEELVGQLTDRIQGSDSDRDWWSSYGIAAGMLIARGSELHGLTQLVDSVPEASLSRVESCVGWLSRPKVATALVLGGLLFLGALPLITSGLRLAVLRARFPQEKLTTMTASADEIREMREMYEELDRQAWPMTKLLADVTANTPDGIELKTVRLAHGEPLVISGTASPKDGKTGPELITQMCDNLRESRIFAEIKPQYKAPDGFTGNNEFDISANIRRATYVPDYPIDLRYDEWPLVDRRRNIGPPDGSERTTALANPDSATDPVRDTPRNDDDPDIVVADDTPEKDDDAPASPTQLARTNNNTPGSSSSTPPRRPENGRPRATFGGSGADRDGVSGVDDVNKEGGVAASELVPEPLSAEQIATMSESEARAALSERATARRYDHGEDIKARLKTEWDQLLAHLKSVRGGR